MKSGHITTSRVIPLYIPHLGNLSGLLHESYPPISSCFIIRIPLVFKVHQMLFYFILCFLNIAPQFFMNMDMSYRFKDLSFALVSQYMYIYIYMYWIYVIWLRMPYLSYYHNIDNYSQYVNKTLVLKFRNHCLKHVPLSYAPYIHLRVTIWNKD